MSKDLAKFLVMEKIRKMEYEQRKEELIRRLEEIDKENGYSRDYLTGKDDRLEFYKKEIERFEENLYELNGRFIKYFRRKGDFMDKEGISLLVERTDILGGIVGALKEIVYVKEEKE